MQLIISQVYNFMHPACTVSIFRTVRYKLRYIISEKMPMKIFDYLQVT